MFSLMIFLSTSYADENKIIGKWLNEKNSAVISIDQKNGIASGTIIWLKEQSAEGQVLLDLKNPDPLKRSIPILRMKILNDANATKNDKWENGRIYDPESGNTYRCTIVIEGDKVLKLRGYVGTPLIGRTVIWKSISENEFDSLCTTAGTCIKE
jgi:uncharacterized protein (DUF2147 family)